MSNFKLTNERIPIGLCLVHFTPVNQFRKLSPMLQRHVSCDFSIVARHMTGAGDDFQSRLPQTFAHRFGHRRRSDRTRAG